VLPERCGIVVATCDAHSTTWLPDCLRSLAGLPVTLRWNTPAANWYDPGALLEGYAAGFDEWWVLPDTVVVTDPAAMVALLGDGRSYALGTRFISCIGKVTRADVDAVGLPAAPVTKRLAVDCELGWFGGFSNRCQVIDPTFWDSSEYVERHGRNNMILRSRVLTKYKGCWSDAMIREA
jgi:hypothetical protein